MKIDDTTDYTELLELQRKVDLEVDRRQWEANHNQAGYFKRIREKEERKREMARLLPVEAKPIVVSSAQEPYPKRSGLFWRVLGYHR